MPALVAGAEADAAVRRFARGEPFCGALDAMIGAVAYEMSERILDQFQYLAVELGLGAMHFEVDLFAELGGQVAHDARQLLPGVADRLHPRFHHAFLQLGGDVGEPLQRRPEIGILVPADDFQELIAGEDQLGNGGHEAIERLDIDADRLARQPFAWVGICALGSGGGGCVAGRGSSSRGIRPLPAVRCRRHRIISCAAPQSPIRASRQPIETFDQITVIPGRLALLRFELF
jgi:hypothetical protein